LGEVAPALRDPSVPTPSPRGPGRQNEHDGDEHREAENSLHHPVLRRGRGDEQLRHYGGDGKQAAHNPSEHRYFLTRSLIGGARSPRHPPVRIFQLLEDSRRFGLVAITGMCSGWLPKVFSGARFER
jgi:hypothetical protein